MFGTSLPRPPITFFPDSERQKNLKKDKCNEESTSVFKEQMTTSGVKRDLNCRIFSNTAQYKFYHVIRFPASTNIFNALKGGD